MTTNPATQHEPLWLCIERKIAGLGDGDLSAGKLQSTLGRLAGEFDQGGMNFSKNAGRVMLLRASLKSRAEVGRPFLRDFDAAVATLTLDDVADLRNAYLKVIGAVGETWPGMKLSERRGDVETIVKQTRIDLLVARAKELGDDAGVRYLIEAGLKPKLIAGSLGITDEEYARVKAELDAELAERTRVAGLLDEVDGKPDDERIKHLINGKVAEDLLLEMAGVDQAALDAVKQAMEEELAEAARKAEEEAALKQAEADGPPLDQIPNDEMLEYIESIREILEFSSEEKEIRTMCGQSSIPKSLVDVAVTEPDKLDELESGAEG